MDNPGSHELKAVRDASFNVGAQRIFLPTYSSDLNSIEQMFSKLKAPLRKARVGPFDDIPDRRCELLAQFSPNEIANYLANSG